MKKQRLLELAGVPLNEYNDGSRNMAKKHKMEITAVDVGHFGVSWVDSDGKEWYEEMRASTIGKATDVFGAMVKYALDEMEGNDARKAKQKDKVTENEQSPRDAQRQMIDDHKMMDSIWNSLEFLVGGDSDADSVEVEHELEDMHKRLGKYLGKQ